MFDRDEQEISQIIENGLEAILGGSATLEGVVALHPEQAEVIRPELEGALWLVSQRQEVEARPGFVTASRKRVVERIKAEARSQGTKHSLFGFAWPQRVAYQWVAVAAVVLVLLLGTGGLVTVSQASLPGDGLYAVKRISEQVSYAVTVSEVGRAQLSTQFAERRMNEVETLVSRGNYTAAESALDSYEQQVNLTLSLLDKVSNSLTREKLGLAIAFKDNLVRNAGRLASLLSSAPTDMRADLQAARELTTMGAAAADDVIRELPPVDVTGTPTPTGTLIGSETPEPEATDTLAPSETPDPDLDNPVVTETPGVPSETVIPGIPVNTAEPKLKPTDTPTPKPKNTPRPTNPNRPTQKSSDGSSGNNGDTGKKDPPGKKK